MAKEKQQIQTSQYHAPCTVLSTIYEKPHCRSYGVSTQLFGIGAATRILQCFPPAYAHLCRHTEEALQKLYGYDMVRRDTGSDGTGYLLLNIPAPSRRRWKNLLAQTPSDRHQTLTGLWDFLTFAEDKGILPTLDKRTLFVTEEGQLCSWDLTDAVLTEEISLETLLATRRKNIARLAALAIECLGGKAIPESRCGTQLALLLHNRLSYIDQSQLLKTLWDHLYEEDLTDPESLLEAVELALLTLEDPCRPKYPRHSDPYLAAANFLYHNPLWKYVRKDENGQNQLRIALLGSGSAMTEAFLDAIIPSAQMLDTQLHIHVVTKNAATFWEHYLKKAPMLPKAVAISGVDVPCAMDPVITGTDARGDAAPLAYLHFEAAAGYTPEQLQSFDPGCVLVPGSCTDAITRTLMTFAARASQPLLVGLATPVPSVAAFGESPVTVTSFAKPLRMELTQTPVYREALTVHTFYSKKYDQRADPQEILKQFQKPYNRNSSIRSALSIPYKLYAYGLTDPSAAAAPFYEQVLQDKRKVQRLVWLEHRSWQAHLMVTGWKMDPATFPEDFKAAGYRQKAESWHGCLFGSHDNGKDPLPDWSMEDWDARESATLDPLDAMSVAAHRLLADYVETTVLVEKTGIIPPAMHKLKTRVNMVCPEDFQQLEQAIESLKANITNSEVGWELVIKDIRANLPEAESADRKEAEALLDTVEAGARAIIARNSRTNYKAVDEAIVKAIPYLLEQQSIRHIYKLWSQQEHPWNNVASAFFLEPRELILLTQEGETVTESQKTEFLNFLQGLRHMDITLQVLPLEALKKLPQGSVLDVTGIPPHRLVAAQEHLQTHHLQLPVIQYRDGKLHSLSGHFPLLRFYRQDQSLTVEETMAVTGTCVNNEYTTVPMHRLHRWQELWETAQGIDRYNDLCNFLAGHRKVYTVWSDARKNQRPTGGWRVSWNKPIAQQRGLLTLLDALQKAAIIKPYSWNNQYQTPTIFAADPRCQRSLNDMLGAYCGCPDPRNLMQLSFQSEDNDALCQLENQDLTCNTVVKLEITIDPDTGDEVKQFRLQSGAYLRLSTLEDALQTLEAKGFIAHLHNTPFLQEDPPAPNDASILRNGGKVTRKVKLRLQYTDIPTMDCLTKAGNVLEAMAYHTIRRWDQFDDVKLGVSILWRSGDQPDAPTHNEIDLICTKGTKTFFISCKKRSKLEKEQITEIRYEADRFGVDSVPILLTTAQEEENISKYARANRMGVEIITVQDFVEQGKPQENTPATLRTHLGQILKKHTPSSE